jgi:hypothetical protein
VPPAAAPPQPEAGGLSNLPKLDMIIQWAAANAPEAVAKIEAHRSTVIACVRAASKMRIWTGEYHRPQKGSMPHPFMQRDFPEIRRDKFEPGVELSKTEFEAAALVRPDPLEGAEAAAALFLELLAKPKASAGHVRAHPDATGRLEDADALQDVYRANHIESGMSGIMPSPKLVQGSLAAKAATRMAMFRMPGYVPHAPARRGPSPRRDIPGSSAGGPRAPAGGEVGALRWKPLVRRPRARRRRRLRRQRRHRRSRPARSREQRRIRRRSRPQLHWAATC